MYCLERYLDLTLVYHRYLSISEALMLIVTFLYIKWHPIPYLITLDLNVFFIFSLAFLINPV